MPTRIGIATVRKRCVFYFKPIFMVRPSSVDGVNNIIMYIILESYQQKQPLKVIASRFQYWYSGIDLIDLFELLLLFGDFDKNMFEIKLKL